MVFCNFSSVHFYRDEEEEKEEQQQEKEEKEKKLHSRYRKTFNVRPSCLDSEDEKDISKKSTEKPTVTKNLTYPEMWLTAKVITIPSNRGSVSSFSVISIHSSSSELDSLKRMRTRATDISMSLIFL